MGLLKTIDNDVVPIRQSLGAWTAAEQGAIFARNIIAEHTSNPRMLIVHEVMGRHCGWLAAATAKAHHDWVVQQEFAGWLENDPRRWDVHGVYVPERPFDIAAEAERLRGLMDEYDCVNLFLGGCRGPRGRRGQGGGRRGGHPRPVRPRADRQDQPGRPVRQAVRRAAGADMLVQKSGYQALRPPTTRTSP